MWGKMKGYRNINVDGEIWQWKVGYDRVAIRNPEGKSFAPWKHELLPSQSDDWDRSIITPRLVRTYIDSHCRPRKELNIDTIKLLQDVYNGKRYGEYAGGTLTIKPNKDDSTFLMFNVGKGKNEREECWICLNYLKYRNPNGSHWNQAVETLRNYPEFYKLLTKNVLRAVNRISDGNDQSA
jgi:hypothetical protein